MLCHWQNFLSIHGDTQQLQKHIGGGGGEVWNQKSWKEEMNKVSHFECSTEIRMS